MERGPGESPEQGTDGQVVACIRAGDREAYRILVRRYQDVLYRHALRMTGQGDAAADLVQGALVKGYSRLGRCRDPERFGAWIFRILANACKDYLKSRRRRDVSPEDDFESFASSTPDPEQTLERAELREMLDGALARIPEQQRAAFVLKHVEGRSYEEIADLLEVSVPALKMRVHRAREALKEVLEEVL